MAQASSGALIEAKNAVATAITEAIAEGCQGDIVAAAESLAVAVANASASAWVSDLLSCHEPAVLAQHRMFNIFREVVSNKLNGSTRHTSAVLVTTALPDSALTAASKACTDLLLHFPNVAAQAKTKVRVDVTGKGQGCAIANASATAGKHVPWRSIHADAMSHGMQGCTSRRHDHASQATAIRAARLCLVHSRCHHQD